LGPLAIVGVALGTLFVAILVLLAIPVDVLFRVDSDSPTPVEVALGLFAGLYELQLTGSEPDEAAEPEPEPAPPETPEPAPPEPEAAEERPPAEDPSRLNYARIGLAVLRTDGFVRHTVRWIRRLVTSFHVRDFSAHLRLGTGDPADTGVLCGRLQSALPVARTLGPVDVTVTPDFDHDVFAASALVRLRASPLGLVWITLRYIVSRTTYRAARAAWRAR
jgi:hypothetical protein